MKLPLDTDLTQRQLGDAALEVLRQLALLINAVGSCYDRQPQGGTSSIGCHARHILDHFSALRAGATTGRIDYNGRSRGSAIETDAAVALEKIETCIDWLNGGELEDIAIEIESEVSISQYQNVCVSGSLHREVIYVISHTIHHIAYAKMIAGQMGVALDDRIGFAPATATYLRSIKCIS